MAGWIAVSFLGAVASLMFLAANYRPAPPVRSFLRRVASGVTAGASSAATGGSPAHPSF